jgi:hypothetical protein
MLSIQTTALVYRNIINNIPMLIVKKENWFEKLGSVDKITVEGMYAFTTLDQANRKLDILV